MSRFWLLLAASLSAPVAAQSSDLPPPEMVERVLDGQPNVEAAAARVEAARAEGDALSRGAHEITAQGTLSRRRVDREGDFLEYDTTISRAFRLPAKAALDRRAGALGLDVAENRREDARHQAALMLASLWYDWLQATELHRNAGALVANQQALVRATARRVELRDAAQLELEQAEAALALARVEVGDAAALGDRARTLLQMRFPDLPLPVEPPRLLAPALPAEGLDQLQLLIVERSHEIGAVASLAERQSVIARRARADRIADPTFGVRLFSERAGEERGAGLFAALPLGGGHRRALARQAEAEASAMRAERTLVEREVAGNAAADVAELKARLLAWKASSQAVQRAEASSGLSARGQQLGAIDLADRLYAERQANDARDQEIAARTAAARLITKLRIDAHTLWID